MWTLLNTYGQADEDVVPLYEITLHIDCLWRVPDGNRDLVLSEYGNELESSASVKVYSHRGCVALHSDAERCRAAPHRIQCEWTFTRVTRGRFYGTICWYGTLAVSVCYLLAQHRPVYIETPHLSIHYFTVALLSVVKFKKFMVNLKQISNYGKWKSFWKFISRPANLIETQCN